MLALLLALLQAPAAPAATDLRATSIVLVEGISGGIIPPTRHRSVTFAYDWNREQTGLGLHVLSRFAQAYCSDRGHMVCPIGWVGDGMSEAMVRAAWGEPAARTAEAGAVELRYVRAGTDERNSQVTLHLGSDGLLLGW